jgi:hypothetical protein
MYQAAPTFNTYAILAIIFAVAILPPLGIYFGKRAKEEIARTGERGIEVANAAVVVGWVFSAIMGVFLIVWCGIFVSAFGTLGGINRF